MCVEVLPGRKGSPVWEFFPEELAPLLVIRNRISF
jgi:hypothetical protein